MTPQLHVTVDYDAFHAFKIAAVHLAGTVQFLLETNDASAFDSLREHLWAQMAALDATRQAATILDYALPKEAADV